jgi:PPOX class probable F420-dependent enzyme
MAREMTTEQWKAFVLEGTRTGKLAVVDGNGAPHVVPVWFVLDGDHVIFTMGDESFKARRLAVDPRVAFCVDDQEPPFSFVLLKGSVTISDDLDEMLPWATQIGARYMGEDRSEEFGRRNAVPGELLVRLHPDRVIAQADVSA